MPLRVFIQHLPDILSVESLQSLTAPAASAPMVIARFRDDLLGVVWVISQAAYPESLTLVLTTQI